MNMKMTMAMLMMYASLAEFSAMSDPYFHRGICDQSDPLEGIDLIEEYKLILLKKSKLSAVQRGRVVYRVEKAARLAEEKEALSTGGKDGESERESGKVSN